MVAARRSPVIGVGAESDPDLKKYVEWCTFIITALQTTQLPFATNEFELRDMLRDFLVPALVRVDTDS